MSLQNANIFEHITLPADELAYAITKNIQGAANWRSAYPTLARLDKMIMRRSATIFPDDCPNDGHDAYILEQLNMPLDTGTALMHAIESNIPAARTDLQDKTFAQWFCLSPVHWQAGRDHVNLLGFNENEVRIEETRELLKAIAPWFSELGWHIHVATSNQWFVRTLNHFDYFAPSLTLAQCGQLESFLPNGRDLNRWQTLLTEIQMRWFEHPVNTKRLANNQLPINSLWLYDGINARALSSQQVNQFIELSNLISTPKQKYNTQELLAWLNEQLTPVLAEVNTQGQAIINILGNTWKQDILIIKPSLGVRIKSHFSKHSKPLNWLEEPSFNFLK